MGCLLRMMQIFKIKTYQQAVLRFGLPFIILYRGTHYLFYRLGSHSVEPYHWFFLHHDRCSCHVCRVNDVVDLLS